MMMTRVSLGIFGRDGPERLWADPVLRRRRLLLAAALLVTVGAFGLTFNRLHGSRQRVQEAMENFLAQPADSELRFLLDVRSDPKRISAESSHRIHFRAGPGPLFRPESAPASVQFPFTLVLDRAGLSLKFRGSFIGREGGHYLQLSEIPPIGTLPEVLLHRWLQIGDKGLETGRGVLTTTEAAVVAERLTAKGILLSVERRGTESVRTVRATALRLHLDEEKFRRLLRDVSEQGTTLPRAGIAEFLEKRLEKFRLEVLDVWVDRKTKSMVRVRVELVPRNARDVLQRVIVDATVLPRTADVGDVPPVPENPARIRPDIVQRIIGGSPPPTPSPSPPASPSPVP